MKKIFFVPLVMLLLWSCDNEIDLNEEWKEIPVVYAIFNPVDTAQYVRLEKAFLDPNISALEVAQIPDSIYFKDAQVFVKDFKTQKDYQFTLVDASKDGFPRDSGIFATTPNYLYKSKEFHPVPSEQYLFYALKSNNNDTLTSAVFRIVDDLNLIRPHDNNYIINLRYINNFNILWEGGDEKGYYDVNIYFNYKEKNENNGGDWEYKTLKWKAGSKITETSYRIEGVRFYTFLRDHLTADPAIKRKFLYFDVEVISIGRELKEYIDILHAGSGITTSLQLPNYTNLSNGYGVVSSVNSVKLAGLLAGQLMRDSLRWGIYTKELNFN